jgi:arylformamidase
MSERVFLSYDRETLDALYDTRRRVPDWEAYTDRFEERSARARERLGTRLDVPYGPHERQRLDLFLPPDADGPVPVHVFFHGGYWRAGDKERYSYPAEAFVPLGAAYVAVEYALVPDVGMDGLVAHCREAVAWVHHHADELGFDRERLVVSGHSAGGHIVGMLMADGWQEQLDIPVDAIAGGCSLSGLHDLEPIRETYLQPALQLELDEALRNSPYRLPPASAAPLVLATGELEGAEFARQTWVLEAYWRSQGVDVTADVLPGHHHYSIVEELGDPASGVSRAVCRLLGIEGSEA